MSVHWKRLFGFVVDWLVCAVLIFSASLVVRSIAPGVYSTIGDITDGLVHELNGATALFVRIGLFAGLLKLLFEAVFGQTIGMSLMGLRLRNGGYSYFFAKYLPIWLLIATPVLSLIMVGLPFLSMDMKSFLAFASAFLMLFGACGFILHAIVALMAGQDSLSTHLSGASFDEVGIGAGFSVLSPVLRQGVMGFLLVGIAFIPLNGVLTEILLTLSYVSPVGTALVAYQWVLSLMLVVGLAVTYRSIQPIFDTQNDDEAKNDNLTIE